MKILYDPTTFNEEAAPGWSADQCNKVGNGIKANAEAISSLPTDPATFNATGSSSSNYNVTSYRSAAPDSGEYPLSMIITPTITNAAGVTITPSWGTTAYPVYDRSTNAQATASMIKANQPVQVIFDGSKFWVTAGGAYPQISATADTNGFFDRGTTAPTGTARLNYSGYMYATRFYGAVFNETASDFAEGFTIDTIAKRGELIKINSDGTYSVNDIPKNTKVIGIVSSDDQYGMLFGTQYGETPIAMCGRIRAKVSGYVRAGDSLVAAYEKGRLMSMPSNCDPQAICAIALESNNSEFGEILVLVKRG